MDATLVFACDGLSNEELLRLTREICATINSSVNADAALAQGLSEAGSKGDPVTVGTIVMTLIGSGGIAVALVQVLKSYLEREKHLRIKVKGKNGQEIELDGSNLTHSQADGAIKLISAALGETR